MIANAIDEPEKNSPNAMMIKLFGNSMLGPIMKFHIPQKNRLRAIIVMGLTNFVKHCTNIAVVEYPMRLQLNTKPLMLTESVNSDIRNDRTGS